MPRDATDTRSRLLDEAERVFASRGVFQATMREITEAAGQRNSSALTYHFGSRDGVLRAILVRHSAPLDAQRAALVDEPLEAMASRDLMAALLLPYAGSLATRSGRDYLRIVAQLSATFGDWRVEDDELTGRVLRRILHEFESRVPAPPEVARERVDTMIMLMTAAIAERARALSEDAALALDGPRFLANLADVLVGGMDAPMGDLLGRPVASASTAPPSRSRR